MRPYFEVEVVRVKKGKENYCWQCGIKMYFKHYYCPYCGNRLKSEKSKGNWVNGENLDKIKFPCFCRFDANKGINGEPGKTYKVNGIGIINKNYYEGKQHYELSWADHQSEAEAKSKIIPNLSVLCGTPSLKTLIEIYDIHILKAKIILFEEE